MKKYGVYVLAFIAVCAIIGDVVLYLKKSDLDTALSNSLTKGKSLEKDLKEMTGHSNALTDELNLLHKNREEDQQKFDRALQESNRKRLEESEAVTILHREQVELLKKEISDQRVKITELNGVIKVQMENNF